MFSIDGMRQEIAKLSSELLAIYVDPDWVENANPNSGAHLALPCFRMAKELSISPDDVATKLALVLKIENAQKIEAQGAYLNVWLSSTVLCDSIVSSKEDLLKDKPANKQTVIIEYLSPNLAKPLSIGHLRNVLQGRALSLMYKNAGYEVITDNHIGDWGTVFGMWVVGFQKFSSDEKLAKGGVEELGRMYIAMRSDLKQEEELEEKPLTAAVQQWLIKLESGDQQAEAYHDRFSEVSLASIKAQMADLDVVFDNNLGESFYVSTGKQMVEELLSSGKAQRNEDGSVIIDLQEQGIETPMLIEKSNGAALYSTSDIATITYREQTWNPEQVIYVVGMEQQFYLKQLFAANQLIGWSDAKLIHHWYGLIEEVDENGKRSKMSSRKKAVFMSDLLKLAVDKAEQIAPENMSKEDIKRIAYGALTFQEFSSSHIGNTVFDWESMFSLSGFSGPYTQYAAVRINSLLNKAGQFSDKVPDGYDWSDEQDILWLLSRYQSVIELAFEERELHKLAEYAYQLARVWNRFYENSPILQAESDDRQARLWLATTIGQYLERSLFLLGIKIPSKM